MQRNLARVFFSATIFLFAGALAEPSAAQTQRDLKACLDIKGEPDQIIRACNVFIRTGRYIDGRPYPKPFFGSIWFMRGVAYQRKNQLDLAISDFNEALAINPKADFAYGLRANTYVRLRDMEHAMADYAQAIRLASIKAVTSENFGNRGILYFDYYHDIDKALSDLSQSIRLNPNSANVFLRRSIIYKIKGDDERADADLKSAIETDPKSRQTFESSRALTDHWLGYLKEIEDENDYANWSGPPLDIYRGVKMASRTPTNTAPAVLPSAASGVTSNPATGSDCALAATHWTSTESIGTRQAYEDHLARFPTCAFATLARARIAALDQKSAPAIPNEGSAKNCPAGFSHDSDGDCVRDKSAQKAASRRTTSRGTGERTGNGRNSTLDCSNPVYLMACANRAFSTTPFAGAR
jgi:tetratricopeptide (TPR) repeat protein